jgi:hypothetical protein
MAVRDSKNYMNNQHNAKYAFYYLLSLVALIFMALSVGMISFGIIDKTIPDILEYYSYSSVNSQLKFALSALFIAAPIFYLISLFISRGLRRGELEKDSAIRRWLTYFIILVSSLIILGSFIGLINSFLAGELTTRFIFKIITMLLISGLTFSFYLYDVKRERPNKPDKIVKIFTFVTLILVITVFVAAWFFVESPKEARARRLDGMVLNNFSSLNNVINNYYELKGELPENLTELENFDHYFNPSDLVDPETKEPFVYKLLNEKEFELCAIFRTSNLNEQAELAYRGAIIAKLMTVVMCVYREICG